VELLITIKDVKRRRMVAWLISACGMLVVLAGVVLCVCNVGDGLALGATALGGILVVGGIVYDTRAVHDIKGPGFFS